MKVRSDPREGIWPPPTPKVQVICVYCAGRLCYAQQAKMRIKGQLTDQTKTVTIEYVLFCASCRRTFDYIEDREVAEVMDG